MLKPPLSLQHSGKQPDLLVEHRANLHFAIEIVDCLPGYYLKASPVETLYCLPDKRPCSLTDDYSAALPTLLPPSSVALLSGPPPAAEPALPLFAPEALFLTKLPPYFQRLVLPVVQKASPGNFYFSEHPLLPAATNFANSHQKIFLSADTTHPQSLLFLTADSVHPQPVQLFLLQ